MKHYVKEILKRVLSDKQMQELDEIYVKAKTKRGRNYWIPSEEDWKLYRQQNTTLEDWKKQWKGQIRSGSAVTERLGRMYLMEEPVKIRINIKEEDYANIK